MEKITDKIRAFPFPATIGVAFLVGLLLGWLAIGWWLWPVSWTDADPWDLRREHQEWYITLVAEGFAQTKNADQAKETLAGWDKGALTDLLITMQDQAPDSETRQQLTALSSALGLPRSEVVAPGESKASPVVPSVGRRLVTVFRTAGIALVVVVLIIFATLIRPWESVARWARRPRTAEAPGLIPGRFVSIYAQGRNDYADYYSVEGPDGRFLGECGLSIGRILGREMPRRVTALEMVLFDAYDHRTETRMLMSRYAYEDAALRQELMTRGELILAQLGAQASVETSNLQMLAIITDLEYADQEPAEGIFQRLEVDLDVKIKQLPTEVESGAA